MAKKESQAQLKEMYANLEKFSRDISAIDVTGTIMTRTNEYAGRKRQADIMSKKDKNE